MSKSTIKIMRAGKGTQTNLKYKSGVPEHTLSRVGSGLFLPIEFSEISDAKAFGYSELQKNPSAVLLIVSGNQILDTLMDQEYQSRKNKRDKILYMAVSSAAVFIIAMCVSLYIMAFTSSLAHVLFTGGMTLLYLVLLFVFGTRNMHALILIGIIIALITFLTPSLRELTNSGKAPDTARKVAEPQH